MLCRLMAGLSRWVCGGFDFALRAHRRYGESEKQRISSNNLPPLELVADVSKEGRHYREHIYELSTVSLGTFRSLGGKFR
jgi:hypothetical protein